MERKSINIIFSFLLSDINNINKNVNVKNIDRNVNIKNQVKTN